MLQASRELPNHQNKQSMPSNAFVVVAIPLSNLQVPDALSPVADFLQLVKRNLPFRSFASQDRPECM
jgi:hypothetical protein